jgi:hypothetical protein
LSQVVRGLRSDWSPPAAPIVGRAASQRWAARHHVRLESMVPYQARAVGCAQGARMLDLTQMDTPCRETSHSCARLARLLSDRGSHDDRAGYAYTRRHERRSRHRRRRPSRISPPSATIGAGRPAEPATDLLAARSGARPADGRVPRRKQCRSAAAATKCRSMIISTAARCWQSTSANNKRLPLGQQCRSDARSLRAPGCRPRFVAPHKIPSATAGETRAPATALAFPSSEARHSTRTDDRGCLDAAL